jgi:uncharacterized protein
MRRTRPILFLCLALLLAAACTPVLAQDFPQPQGYVNDFAGLLSSDNITQLEAQLAQLEQDTGAQIAVVTVKSMDGSSIEDYASRLFEAWGIGQKHENNGVLFITAIEEHMVRIEVGYGLEPVLTDGRCGRILDYEVVPYFKDDNYTEGIVSGVNAIEGYIRDGTPPAPLEENPVSDTIGNLFPVIMFISIVGMYLTGFMARSKSVWLGAIFGAIAGVILGLVAGGIPALVIATLLSSGFGAGLDAILSRNYQTRKASGKSTGWWGSGGGFRGGGSGGSFGGFGGGMSGGGGASRGF